jgi:hypothetical protein
MQRYAAAKAGSLACLRYLHAHNCPTHRESLDIVVDNNAVECVKYLHEEEGYVLTADMLLRAVQVPQSLYLVMYLIDHGCPIHPYVLATTTRHGSIEMMQYVHDHGQPWSVEILVHASDNLAKVKYLHEHGCPLGVRVFGHIFESIRVSGTSWEKATLMEHARVVHYLVWNGCPYLPEHIPRARALASLLGIPEDDMDPSKRTTTTTTT